MKYVITFSLLLLASYFSHAASPAATQAWVKNYVANNSQAVSADWIATYLTTSGVIQAAVAANQNPNSFSSDTEEGIVNQIMANAALSMFYTNSAIRVMYSPVYTNLTREVFAPVGAYWTNVVLGASVVTSAAKRITFNYGNYRPWTTNGTINLFTVYSGGIVSTNGIDFYSTKVSDADIIRARGN